METLRNSIRVLKTQPVFATLLVLALGLGIGANCALFTVINSLVLRPLPYENPAELVEVSLPQRRPALDDLRRAQSFAGIAAFLPWGFSVPGVDGVRNLYGFKVAGNLFSVLGVQPALGRSFSADEPEPVVILSDPY